MNKRTNVSYRTATQTDIEWLVPRLRQADIDECEALFGAGSTQEAALYGLHPDGYAFVAELNGERVAAFGVCPGDAPGVGTPWMIGTDQLERCARELLTDATPCIAIWLKVFPVLTNIVDARNKKSIRWLKHLGFTVHAPEPSGISGLPFHVFDMGVAW